MPRVSGVNRSEEIRKWFLENPGCGIKDCVEGLAARGLAVSYGLVAAVRQRQKTQVQDMKEGVEVVGEDDLRRVKDFIGHSNLDPDVAVRILKDFADLVQVSGGLSRFRSLLDGVVGGGSSYMDVNDDDED